MARVLAISSQVAYGPVGLTALVPALQARGHEVLAVPAITLSNHPGHGKPAGFRTPAEDLRAIFAALEQLGALDGLSAILTGYFATPEQVAATAAMIRDRASAASPPWLLVDPVIGDGDALYVPEDVAAAIREQLMPLATITTPNRFELEWLSRVPVRDEDSAVTAARRLAARECLATSIPASEDTLATLLIGPDGVHRRLSHKRAQVPHGTGDFLSGAYLAEHLLRPAAEAFAAAMAALDRAIALSEGSAILDVARALHGGEAASKQPTP
jgi:pyridoxine kinase